MDFFELKFDESFLSGETVTNSMGKFEKIGDTYHPISSCVPETGAEPQINDSTGVRRPKIQQRIRSEH